MEFRITLKSGESYNTEGCEEKSISDFLEMMLETQKEQTYLLSINNIAVKVEDICQIEPIPNS